VSALIAVSITAMLGENEAAFAFVTSNAELFAGDTQPPPDAGGPN
tara:strand:- start:783 stop:917 length:135 start_codon:yes stop_codon:yes gene_type:complete